MPKFKDLTGQRFGYLTIIKKAGKSKNNKTLWLCKCDCGNEKTSQAGNDYWQVKVESKAGVKVCDNLMFCGKAAGTTLAFFTALRLAAGENCPPEEIHSEDVLGGYLYTDVVTDNDSDFLKFPWSSNGYRAYEGKAKKEVVIEEKAPWD